LASIDVGSIWLLFGNGEKNSKKENRLWLDVFFASSLFMHVCEIVEM
jgi:hypothetical protein